MASNLFFIPRFQVFKALNKISVYDILTNNFNVNPSKKTNQNIVFLLNSSFKNATSFMNHQMTAIRCLLNELNIGLTDSYY